MAKQERTQQEIDEEMETARGLLDDNYERHKGIVDALFAIAAALERLADTQERELELAKKIR